jgi:hypothetical protein
MIVPIIIGCVILMGVAFFYRVCDGVRILLPQIYKKGEIEMNDVSGVHQHSIACCVALLYNNNSI